jgi:hypothetical protein
MRQGLELEPLLAAIADFLNDHEELVTKIRGDLRRGLKQPDTGRNGIAPREVLRSLVLMRVKNWDYRELRERIADGYTLRLFTGFGCRPVPKHNAFHRAFVRLTPSRSTRRSSAGPGSSASSRSRTPTCGWWSSARWPTSAGMVVGSASRPTRSSTSWASAAAMPALR